MNLLITSPLTISCGRKSHNFIFCFASYLSPINLTRFTKWFLAFVLWLSERKSTSILHAASWLHKPLQPPLFGDSTVPALPWSCQAEPGLHFTEVLWPLSHQAVLPRTQFSQFPWQTVPSHLAWGSQDSPELRSGQIYTKSLISLQKQNKSMLFSEQS